MMIEFNIDELVRQASGRYPLVTLVQMRMRELQRGAQPLVESRGSHLEITLREIEEGKIWITMGEEAEKLHEQRGLEGGAAPSPPAPPSLPKPGKSG